MRTTTRCTVSTNLLTHLVTLAAGLVVAAASTGCATSPSIEFPWQQKRSADASSEQPATTRGADDHTDAVDEATYWAKKSVEASRQIAYADQLRTGTEQETKPVAEDDSQTGDKPPQTTSAAGASESSDDESSSQPTQSNDSPSQSTATASTNTSPKFRSVDRHRQIAATAPRAEGWPVGLPDDSTADSGQHTPFSPNLDRKTYDLTTDKGRAAFKDNFALDPAELDGTIAIPGTYLKPDIFENFEDSEFRGFNHLTAEQKHNQLAVVTPGKRVAVYAGTEKFASLDIETDVEMPDDLAGVKPVSVIEDGTTQLLFYWPEKPDDGDTIHFKAGVLKVIGPYLGRIFEQTVATRPTEESSNDEAATATEAAGLKRTNYVEFLRGESENLIRITPADANGKPAVDEAKILEWNPWEGIFRVPKPPPTAPDQTS